jgi:hypothetical protein
VVRPGAVPVPAGAVPVPVSAASVRKVMTSAGSATAGVINGRAKAAASLLSKDGPGLGPERDADVTTERTLVVCVLPA